MSDMHDTRRLHGGGTDREPDEIKPAPATPVPRCAKVSDSGQLAWLEGECGYLHGRMTGIGDALGGVRVRNFFTILAVCVILLGLMWRQQTNFEERIRAEREATTEELKKVHDALYQVDKNRETAEQRVYFVLNRIVLHAVEDRKTIAELQTRLAEIPKRVDVVVEDPPEQKTEKTADASASPKPLSLAELRQYDGEIIVAYGPFYDGAHCITVKHLPYAYGERVRVNLCLSREDYDTLWRAPNYAQKVNVRALEDVHRNR